MLPSDDRGPARALLLLALLSLSRALWSHAPSGPWTDHARPIELSLPDLSGSDFRLLPGVGPVLAERLERARRATPDGRLEGREAAAVTGVGPRLLSRWRAIGALPGRPRRPPAAALSATSSPRAPAALLPSRAPGQ